MTFHDYLHDYLHLLERLCMTTFTCWNDFSGLASLVRMTLYTTFTYWNDFVFLPSLIRMTLFDYLHLLE